MGSMNKVYLIGRVTKDLELKMTPGGVAVLDLRLAVDDSYKGKDGQSVEKTIFLDVSVWGKLAEVCEKYLSKGSPVLVEGKLEMNEWQTPEGEKRSKLRVRANDVQFLGSPSGGKRETLGTTTRGTASPVELSDEADGPDVTPF